MCVLRKHHHEVYIQSADEHEKPFEVKLENLRDLMRLRDKEAYDYIEKSFGGVEGIARQLQTNVITGIRGDAEDLKRRQAEYGHNEIPPKPPKSFLKLVLQALEDTTLIILIVCAFISIGLSFYSPDDTHVTTEEYEFKEESNLEWIEGVAIFIAVVVVVLVTAFNDWRKEKQFRGLQDRIEKESIATVVRNSHIEQINIKDLVVGDICCIKYGDLLPADGIIVQSSDIRIDESSLTGETDLVKKDERNVILLAGTHVMEGSGKFLVTAVGLNSQTGIIFSLLGAAKEDKKLKKHQDKRVELTETRRETTTKKTHRSVLQAKLSKLAIQIGYVGIAAAGVTFILLCLRLFIEEFLIKKNPWSNSYIKYILSFLIQGVTVIVVAVPEGLPLAVTLALAYAVRQMTKDNNLVRHLDACETMGSATTICSDKTGTLTTNRMTVVESYIEEKFFKETPRDNAISDVTKKLIFDSISIDTNYTSKLEPPKQPGELVRQLGNKTECALLGFVNDLGNDYNEIRKANPVESFVKVYPFSSLRKNMSTVIKGSEPGSFRIYTKGASEIILSKCTHILKERGNVENLSSDLSDKIINDVVQRMALDGLRTIAVAYRDFFPKSSKARDNAYLFDKTPDWSDEEEIVSNLTLIAILGIEDPVRKEVPDAIKKCQTSGVVVRMITGDNKSTATSIALKCGIIKPGEDFLVLESKDFNAKIRDSRGEISQALLDKVWPKLRVLARSSPQDKYTLINGIVESKLSTNREVVAVTGDGTNDAPALKRADVGFAMGIQGTDVAKEASDIILTDDNFSSIVKAMMWGRNVYDSIAKFLQFQLTANLSAGLFSIICAATISAVPLKAVQMLWVNLVMDTLASLALSTEPPTEKLLERKPYGRTKPMISLSMVKNIIFHGIFQLIVCLSCVWFSEELFGIDSVVKYHNINKLKAPSQHFSMIFNVFVIMTLFNEINARKIHGERNVFEGILRNPFFYVIWLTCFFGQILIVNFGGIAFAVERLDIDHWLWCIFFGVGTLLWGQLVSSIPTSFVKKVFFCFVRAPPAIPSPELPEAELEKITAARITWLRSIKRIKQEVQVISAFKTRLEEVREKTSAYSSVTSLHHIQQHS